MGWETYYKEHRLSMDQLIAKLPRENAIFLSSHAAAEPKAILKAMVKKKENFRNIKLHNLLVMGEVPYCQPGVEKHIRYSTIFACMGSRKAIAEGRTDYVPLYYHEYPKYVKSCMKPNVMILHISEPDAYGWCSFGTTVDFQMAAAEQADLVVAQINKQMPRAMGNSRIHITQINWFTEVDEALPEIPKAKIGPVEKAIGTHCASLIRDKDCLQLGIGAIPDAVLMQLTDKHDLGIHSEMLSESVVDLMESGNITNRYKQLDPMMSTATFAMGTGRLYRYMNDNLGINMAPVDYTNHPRIICQQKQMVTVNSALQIDLFGQVAADTVGKMQFSGPGGQVDFVRGANMAEEGRNIIALPSTAKKGTVSRISLRLPEGGTVTTNRFDVDYVITEYGIAKLWGKNNEERAEELISIAHPDFRQRLKKEYLDATR